MSSRPTATLIARLLDEHGPPLTLYASQWTSEPDDCVQQAFIELAKLSTTPDSPAAWLYRVTKRRALNAWRSTRRRRGREQEAFRHRLEVATTASDPAAALALAEMVAQLDVEPREAIVLRTWGGLTFQEIGEALGLSTATAARRYEQGLAALREQWLTPTNDSYASDGSDERA